MRLSVKQCDCLNYQRRVASIMLVGYTAPEILEAVSANEQTELFAWMN